LIKEKISNLKLIDLNEQSKEFIRKFKLGDEQNAINEKNFI
jgi:hypothetical protein